MTDNKCGHRLCPDHCCNVDGLWWVDDEWPPVCQQIWERYITALGEFTKIRDETAIALGVIAKTIDH